MQFKSLCKWDDGLPSRLLVVSFWLSLLSSLSMFIAALAKATDGLPDDLTTVPHFAFLWCWVTSLLWDSRIKQFGWGFVTIAWGIFMSFATFATAAQYDGHTHHKGLVASVAVEACVASVCMLAAAVVRTCQCARAPRQRQQQQAAGGGLLNESLLGSA